MVLRLVATALVLSCTLGHAQQVANDTVTYAPDVVGVDRLFLVILRVPREADEVQVTLPDCVILLDRTPLPAKNDERRFYFRATAPSKKAELIFFVQAAKVVVPLEIWSLEDLRQFRTLKGQPLPRRWPLGEVLPELKQGRTLYSDAEIEETQGRASGRAREWAALSDDDIWAMQPDSTIPRWHWVNVNYGCPVHGTDIYLKRAYYPWEKSTSFPWSWKIQCPVGQELYPSNDFANGDFTRGGFPDDGVGGACLHQSKRYGFIAEICQFYCHRMLMVAPDCADAYVATKDVKYLHKCLVAMSRVAVEYAYLATMTQHRHRNSQSQVERIGQGRFDEGPIFGATGLTVYAIDQPGYQWRYAESYDRIMPDISKDDAIIPFLQGKGIRVQTHEDVRRFLEQDLFAVWMQAAMDGATQSNEPYHQRGLARMAEMLNYQRGTEFLDWLYDGAGKMRIFVPNTYFRDGSPYESTGGYNGMHVVGLGPIVESVEHLRKMRPDVYPVDRYPALNESVRYKNVFDFCMDTVTIDRAYPEIGDTGSYPQYRKQGKITWHSASAEAFEHAYKMFPSPKFAWALANAPGWRPSKEFPFTREQIETEAAAWPDDWNSRSALADGYGIALLRGGQGDDKRAFWLRYGMNRGHTQDDVLDIGLQAYQGEILSHMGYPRNWGYWEHSWSSHNVARQFPYLHQVARAQLAGDAGVVHVTEALAVPYAAYSDDGSQASTPEDSWQRRMLALIDVSATAFYCLDFYRISGGQEHWWAFHAQEGKFRTSGIELQPQAGGTLAGADVPYGDEKWMRENGCSKHPSYGWRGTRFVFPHLYNVEKGVSHNSWLAHWDFSSPDPMQLRLHMLEATGADGSPMQVNITDGRAASGGSPYEMKWIMLRNQAEAPCRSQVMSLVEPYPHEPVIQSARRIALPADEEGGFSAGACEVRLSDRVDTIFCAADSDREHRAGDFTFAGRFGLYAEKDGQPVALSLVGGTRLLKGGVGIVAPCGEYRGAITAFDRDTRKITVCPEPPTSDAVIGATIFITNERRRIAYKVAAAEAVPGGVELHLDLDPMIGTGQVAKVGDHRVFTPTDFPLHGYGYYDGARIVNADATHEYRIHEVRSKGAALIDRQVHPEATADTLAGQFAAGSWFQVYDFGVGDEVVWPYSISVTRTAQNTYDVQSPVPIELIMP